MKISKTTPRKWAGNGFGHSGAGYGVEGRDDIRVIRDGAHWYAYADIHGERIKFFATSKAELESDLANFFDFSTPSNDQFLAALGPCGR
jgi:hypothetical protein